MIHATCSVIYTIPVIHRIDCHSHLYGDTWQRPPRHILTHGLRGLQDATWVGDIAVCEAADGEVGLLVGRVILHRLKIAHVWRPVEVVEEVVIA